MNRIDVVILAAGQGTRAGLEYPKQFLRIAGKPAFIHAIELFEGHPEVENIILVAIPGEVNVFGKLVQDYGIEKVRVVPGDKGSRQLSVSNGLLYVKNKQVIIHEAVRPFVTDRFIYDMIHSAKVPLVPVVDVAPTIVSITEVNVNYVKRDYIKVVQLPQKFNTHELRVCHKRAIMDGKRDFTDDSSMMWYYGQKINFIEGLEENVKITTPLDVKIAEVLYEENSRNNRR